MLLWKVICHLRILMYMRLWISRVYGLRMEIQTEMKIGRGTERKQRFYTSLLLKYSKILELQRNSIWVVPDVGSTCVICIPLASLKWCYIKDALQCAWLYKKTVVSIGHSPCSVQRLCLGLPLKPWCFLFGPCAQCHVTRWHLH